MTSGGGNGFGGPHAPFRKATGADFPGDREVRTSPIAKPYKHSAIAQRLEAESIRQRAALSAFYAAGKLSRTGKKAKAKRA